MWLPLEAFGLRLDPTVEAHVGLLGNLSQSARGQFQDNGQNGLIRVPPRKVNHESLVEGSLSPINDINPYFFCTVSFGWPLDGYCWISITKDYDYAQSLKRKIPQSEPSGKIQGMDPIPLGFCFCYFSSNLSTWVKFNIINFTWMRYGIEVQMNYILPSGKLT